MTMSKSLPDRAEALAMHRTMVRIRVFETRVEELFLARKLPGFVHTYIGDLKVDLVAPDGSLLVSDDGAGAIYRIRYRNQ